MGKRAPRVKTIVTNFNLLSPVSLVHLRIAQLCSIAKAADMKRVPNVFIEDLCITMGFPNLGGSWIFSSGFRSLFDGLFLREASDRVGSDDVLSKIDALMD